MDLRWLTAEEQELEAAIEEFDEDARPDVEGRGSASPAASTPRSAGWWEQPDRRVGRAGKRLARRKTGVRWSIARKHGLELVAVIIAQVAFLLPLAGVGLTAYRLYKAFIAG